MLFGLAIGLSVAMAIYVNDRAPGRAVPTATRTQPASLDAESRGIVEDDAKSATTQEEESRFSFYEMLPKFEVVIPDEEPDVTVDSETVAIDQPGLYVLQAGSFSAREDADRRRAVLALHGIESHIQRVSIDERVFHRVRIGPMRDLNELNVTRSRLRAAEIDVLRIRLGDD